MAKGRKTGGRVKGTANKLTYHLREKLSDIVTTYYFSQQFADDMAALEPRERVAAVEKLTAYAAPKQQSTSVDVSMQNKTTIEDKLKELTEDKDE